MKRIEVKLSLSIVTPLIEVIKTVATSQQAAGREDAGSKDVAAVLALFPPNFFSSGYIAIDGSRASAILRGCSELRLRMHAQHPSGVLEPGVPDSSWVADKSRAVPLTYQFLATLQEVILEKFTPRTLVWKLSDNGSSLTSFGRQVVGGWNKIVGRFASLRIGDRPAELEKRALVVVDDPVNLMNYVTVLFEGLFVWSRAEAAKHMLEVHEKGRSIVWMGPREKAENYASTLRRWHLTVLLEPR